MTEPLNSDDFAAWNTEERHYCVLMAHRGRLAWWKRLLRRKTPVCTHTGVRLCTLDAAIRSAKALSEAGPCVVALLDLDSGELAGKWITDPSVRDVRLEQTLEELGP